ncbi:MAG TPA: hypothetical protein VH120_09095, partial [Gemmataceae bacterium]|nr:hypothetical protein [Gemmataceae bacterium]
DERPEDAAVRVEVAKAMIDRIEEVIKSADPAEVQALLRERVRGGVYLQEWEEQNGGKYTRHRFKRGYVDFDGQEILSSGKSGKPVAM